MPTKEECAQLRRRQHQERRCRFHPARPKRTDQARYLPKLAIAAFSLGCYLMTPSAVSQVVNKQDFETEAQRLEAVRTLIRQEKLRRLVGGTDGKSNSTAGFCEGMLKDLLNHKGFKAIEPVAVLGFEYPIQNPNHGMYERDESLLPPREKQQSQSAAKQLGPFLKKSIQRCTDEEAAGDEIKGSVLFNGFNYMAGAPPFRAYMLPKNLNPFPEAKLVYWSEYVVGTGKGRKGYSWLNMDICEHVNGTFGLSDSLRLRDDSTGQIAALTRYRGKLVAWEVSRNYAIIADHFESKYETAMKSRTICHWATFPEESVSK